MCSTYDDPSDYTVEDTRGVRIGSRVAVVEDLMTSSYESFDLAVSYDAQICSEEDVPVVLCCVDLQLSSTERSA